ncbi:MAG: uroporphyrinogen decarboxylase family protein [Bryobacteraceae bacterium]
MTSKELVRAALNHKEPARLPLDFGGTSVTGIHVTCVAALRDYYGLEKRPVKVHEPYQMLGWLDEDLKAAMGIDVDGVFSQGTMFGFPLGDWRMWRTEQGLEVLVPGGFLTTKDADGNILIYPEGDTSAPPSGRMPKGGYFFDSIIRQDPIDEEKLNPEDNLEEFGLVTDATLAHFAAEVRRVSGSGRGVIASFGGTAFGDIALVPGPGLKHPKGIRDVAEWYMATVSRKDYVHQVFSKQCEIAIRNLEKIQAAVGDSVDAAFVCGTDFGTQTSTFCSAKAFRDLYLPYYKKVNDWVHAHTDWKTFKHSCGAVERFIPLFIEAGFDILNPVQCSAAGMDPNHLKQEYGDRITFWGGGIDTQRVLPFGTPDQVREQVLERCRTFSPGGGFVFNAIHNVQARTPVENIVAMINAVNEFNG